MPYFPATPEDAQTVVLVTRVQSGVLEKLSCACILIKNHLLVLLLIRAVIVVSVTFLAACVKELIQLCFASNTVLAAPTLLEDTPDPLFLLVTPLPLLRLQDLLVDGLAIVINQYGKEDVHHEKASNQQVEDDEDGGDDTVAQDANVQDLVPIFHRHDLERNDSGREHAIIIGPRSVAHFLPGRILLALLIESVSEHGHAHKGEDKDHETEEPNEG
mmetsp:Transcript_1819/g.3585  ORF Transcript_1819/g.3585 Transcript_1819/m.3585 type:complete len:216 (+) Transcript_1819:2943-3590(+)